MNQARIDELRALCKDATSGPWHYDGMHNEIKTQDYHSVVNETFGRNCPGDNELEVDEFGHCYFADFAFIAAARSALPEALDEIERLQKENADLEEEMHKMIPYPEWPE